MTWEKEINELRRRSAMIEKMGGPDKIKRQHDAGRLTVRERLKLLLDEDSFEEYDMFVAHRCTDFGMEKNRPYGDEIGRASCRERV